MKRGRSPLGFTITEVMIFLAVSGALLLVSIRLISATQNRAQFTDSLNDIQQRIDAVYNNVSNGYYSNDGGVLCKISGTTLTVVKDTTMPRGTNTNCTYLGRVIQFIKPDKVIIHDVAGLRLNGTLEVTDMKDAYPVTLSNTETFSLKNGLSVKSMKSLNGGPTQIGAVGFFSSFGKKDTKSLDPEQLQSSAQQTDFIGLYGTGLSSDTTTTTIANSSFKDTYDTRVNPTDGVEICFESSNGGEHGLILIGGKGRTGSSSQKVSGGVCP